MVEEHTGVDHGGIVFLACRSRNISGIQSDEHLTCDDAASIPERSVQGMDRDLFLDCSFSSFLSFARKDANYRSREFGMLPRPNICESFECASRRLGHHVLQHHVSVQQKDIGANYKLVIAAIGEIAVMHVESTCFVWRVPQHFFARCTA